MKPKNALEKLKPLLSAPSFTSEEARLHGVSSFTLANYVKQHELTCIRMRNLTLGKTTIKVGHNTLPIFDREQTIVDAFRFLGRETALKALKIALAKRGLPNQIDDVIKEINNWIQKQLI